MNGFSTEPDHLRAIAAHLNGYTSQAEQLRQRAVAGQGAPNVVDYPKIEFGQRAGRLWDEARPVFADGLALITKMLAQTAENFTAAAARYEATDSASADSFRAYYER